MDELLTLIDEIKELIPDQKYIDIMGTLQIIHNSPIFRQGNRLYIRSGQLYQFNTRDKSHDEYVDYIDFDGRDIKIRYAKNRPDGMIAVHIINGIIHEIWGTQITIYDDDGTAVIPLDFNDDSRYGVNMIRLSPSLFD